MLNGLLVLYGDKNKMSGLVYRLLHTVLTEDGVFTKVRPGNDISTVLEAVQIRSGLKVRHYDDVEVADAIRKINFNKQIAVCVVDSGQHAILLTGRTNGWIEAFDPDWDSVKRKYELPNAYIIQPEMNKKCLRGRINVLIEESYLVRTRGDRKGRYHMGAIASRTLTVMGRR